MCQFHWLPGKQGTGSRNLSRPTNWKGKNVTEKRGMEIKNRQAQNLSLTKFMPIAMASCGQACCQDIFCRLSLSSWNWTLDGVSSPSPFGAFNGRRTCLLQWAQWNFKREWKAPGAFLTVVFQRYHVFWVLCGYLPANKSCPAPSESVSPVRPVRPNRECGRFPTRVASVSAVCGMLSLRASMQVNGRCATNGNQDVIFLP